MDIAVQELNRVKGPFACGIADKADQISALWTGTIGRGAADGAPWGAIRAQHHKATDGRYEERSGKAAPGTHPSLRDCGPKRKRRPHNADAFA